MIKIFNKKSKQSNSNLSYEERLENSKLLSFFETLFDRHSKEQSAYFNMDNVVDEVLLNELSEKCAEQNKRFNEIILKSVPETVPTDITLSEEDNLKLKLNEEQKISSEFKAGLNQRIDLLQKKFVSASSKKQFNKIFEQALNSYIKQPIINNLFNQSARTILEMYEGYFIAKEDGFSLEDYFNIIYEQGAEDLFGERQSFSMPIYDDSSELMFDRTNISKKLKHLLNDVKKSLEPEERERSSQPGND